jgi:hypothetical protein
MRAILRWALFFGLLGVMAWTALRADPKNGGDLARIKAVYLYHFATFTEWPEHAAATSMKEIHLCVTGGGEVESQLFLLAGKELDGGRVLRVVQARWEELSKTCHMVFFGETAHFNANPAWMRLRGLPLLSVSDQPGFAQGGGMIEMFLRDDKVRMRINLGAVRSAGIHLSSKLLRLAEIVETP